MHIIPLIFLMQKNVCVWGGLFSTHSGFRPMFYLYSLNGSSFSSWDLRVGTLKNTPPPWRLPPSSPAPTVPFSCNLCEANSLLFCFKWKKKQTNRRKSAVVWIKAKQLNAAAGGVTPWWGHVWTGVGSVSAANYAKMSKRQLTQKPCLSVLFFSSMWMAVNKDPILFLITVMEWEPAGWAVTGRGPPPRGFGESWEKDLCGWLARQQKIKSSGLAVRSISSQVRSEEHAVTALCSTFSSKTQTEELKSKRFTPAAPYRKPSRAPAAMTLLSRQPQRWVDISARYSWSLLITRWAGRSKTFEQ